MKHEIRFNFGGGLFSYMGILLENLNKWDDKGIINPSDSIYVDHRGGDGRSYYRDLEYNFFDYILEQEKGNGEKTLNSTEIHPVYLNEFLNKKEKYKYITKNYLKLHPEIKKQINTYVNGNFGGNVLGVHVRVTDMNHSHPYLGIVNNTHYLDKISQVLNNGNFDKVFVASDNNETIEQLIKEYGDLIMYYPTEFRSETSSNFTLKTVIPKWSKNPQFFIDSFIDCMILSNCDESIGRISTFNWFSQSVHTSKIKKYHHIDGDKPNRKDPNL
jgi:hypothetical protein